MALGEHVFAQDVSAVGPNTITLRRRDAEQIAPMEWGLVERVGAEWMTVPLQRGYVDPVVIVKPVSGDQPTVVRLRNVSGSSFQLRCQSWEYVEGPLEQEQIFYFVVEAGEHEIDGLRISAGRQDTRATVEGGFHPVAFPWPFESTPAVFSAIQTFHGAEATVSRIDGRSQVGFGLALQVEEAATAAASQTYRASGGTSELGMDRELAGHHPVETLGWVAMEPGAAVGTTGRRLEVRVEQADSGRRSYGYGFTPWGAFPTVLADVGSTLDADPCNTRFSAIDSTAVELFLQEEQSADDEMAHGMEELMLFVAD
jgi:hypothetical protein